MRPPHLAAAGATAATVTLYLSACSSSTSPAWAQFADQGVRVRVEIKDRTAAPTTLAATFTPQRPGFHLYSIDLPATGIHGVGRPIKVVAQGALRSAGRLTTEAKVVMMPLAGTTLTLPVYPDGPVTVDLPVTTDGQGPATVLVSYAACSPTTCMPPVTDHPLNLHITTSRDGLTAEPILPFHWPW